jgi:hypothetical protein
MTARSIVQASPAGRSVLAQAINAAVQARSSELRDAFENADAVKAAATTRAASASLKKAAAEGRLKKLSATDKLESMLAGKVSLADKEESVFDSKSWCRGCAPTFPLADVVSSNAQRVASNNDNMMAMYRKTNKVSVFCNHENREQGGFRHLLNAIIRVRALEHGFVKDTRAAAQQYMKGYGSGVWLVRT